MTLLGPIFRSLRHHAAGAGRKATFAALGLLLLSLGFLTHADSWYENQLRLKQQAETGEDVRTRGQALSVMINTRLSRLQGLAGFVIAAEDEEAVRDDFETYAAGHFASARGVRYMALAPGGVAQYVYAPDSQSALLGQELAQDPDPEVRASVERALTTDEPVLAGPLTLPGGELILIGTRAVYRHGEYWGLVQIALDLPVLLSDAGISTAAAPLELALGDAHGRVFMGSQTLFSRSPVQTEIPVAGQRWTLAGIPAGGWEAAIQTERLLARTTGLLLVALLTTVVYLTVDRQGRLKRAVERRTRELAEAHQLLEQRVQERTRELQTLLDVSRNVASTLDFSSLLPLLLEQLQQVVDFSGLTVYLVQDEDRLALVQYHGAPPRDQAAQQRKQNRQLPSADLLSLRAPLIISDLSADRPGVAVWRRAIDELAEEGAARRGSWMAVPLLFKNRSVGVLVFNHATANYYTPRHAQLALAMANHVAVAIENARLYEQAHSLAALQERQKLARELHDSVSQALYGIGLGTRTALTLLDKNVTETEVRASVIRQPLEYTMSLAGAALAEMRALIFELRPETLEVEGLIPALTRFSDALQARHHLDLQATFGTEPELSLAAKEVLYRVAQEALHNVVKHAEASRAVVSLTTVDGHVVLEIYDDGIGFDPQDHFPGHLGLQSMRERVEGIGGSLTVQSARGEDTLIRARIPVQSQ